MARGVNRVTLIGNLGNDPNIRYTASGSSVANITVATSETWKDKETGDSKEKTEWHRVVFFKRLAEIVGEYLRKGSKVYIEGKLQTRKWKDKEGNDRYTTEIIAREMQMLDSRASTQRQEQSQPHPSSHQHSKEDTADEDTRGVDDFVDEDIPF